MKITDLLWLFAEEEWGEHDVEAIWNGLAREVGIDAPLDAAAVAGLRVAMEQLRFMVMGGVFEDYRPSPHNPLQVRVYLEPGDRAILLTAQGDATEVGDLTEIQIRRHHREAGERSP